MQATKYFILAGISEIAFQSHIAADFPTTKNGAAKFDKGAIPAHRTP